MSDNISVPITEENISVVLSEGATWDGISGKPATFPASGHTQSATTILPVVVQTLNFAIPLAIDVTTYKDWKCSNASGNATLNITGESDGDAGIIEIINLASGVITPGTMFTKNAGGGTYDSASGVDNIIAWMKSGSDIIYSINQVS